MNRTLLSVLAALAGLLAAGGIVLAATNSHDAPAGQQGERHVREHESSKEPTELLAARQAAEEFLPGYLAYSYGQPGGSLTALRRVSPGLLEQLRQDGPPRITPGQEAAHPRITSLSVWHPGPTRLTAAATAMIREDAHFTWPATIQLEKQADGWVVTALTAP
jgi:hypothetical protein